MRQAVTILMVGLWMVPTLPARAEGPPPAGEPAIIARARRMIQAGDREAALGLLEDALIDGPAGDRPAVVGFLRRSYESMAREAEAAGRPEAAAHYRDNLAILNQTHQTTPPAPAPRPRVEPARPKVEPSTPKAEPSTPEAERPTPKVEPSSPRVGPSRTRIEPPAALRRPTEAAATESVPAESSASPDPKAIVPPSAGVEPPAESIPPELRAPMPDPSLSEPEAMSEPAKLPVPGPVPRPPAAARPQGPVPAPRADATIVPTQEGTREIPMTRPAAAEPVGAEGGEALINPGDAIGSAGTQRPVAVEPREAPRRAEPVGGMAPASGPTAGSGELARADQFFRAQNFDESGHIYAALAARNALPADRRPHWAYCRFKAVVRRINAGPRSSREWDAIEAEVRSIRQLTPGNWYGEYLINKIAEARRSKRRRGGNSDNLVVRGSSPDDPSPPIQQQAPAPDRRRPGLLGRSRGTTAPAPAQPAEDQPLNLPGNLSLPDAPSGAGSPARPRNGGASNAAVPPASNEAGAIPWKIHESPNFRIYHCDPALAERAATIAESVRTAQGQRWGSTGTRAPWSPRCELFLYPTADAFAEATGQPATSPGLSTISNNGAQVLSRRMSLRADNPLLLQTTLPHEVTHIVLADLFVARAIPRWADEGIAVLVEPESEQRHREADLKGPLDGGRVFDVGRLMAMDYPDPKDWRLFYAQSVSLTRFLVEQGPPERFIQFIRDSQRVGSEAALRDVYHIDGLAALQERWLDYARKQTSVDVASSRSLDTAGEGIRRD